MSGGWIAWDLDGTLAVHGEWRGVNHIGAPIAANLDRLRACIAKGITCKVMTARVCRGDAEADLARQAIQNWLAKHGLPRLEVTCVKDYAMMFLVDDRAVSVESNTGRILGGPQPAIEALGYEAFEIEIPEVGTIADPATTMLILPKNMETT